MGAQASAIIPINCGATTSIIRGEIKMADGEYLARLYFPFFGTPAAFHGRPFALCAAKSPISGVEQYLGTVTGRSEYIYSAQGFKGFRCFKDADGIVQKIELFENGAPGAADSSLSKWTISTVMGQSMTSWTSERMEKNGMVATSIKFEIAGQGAENGVGTGVYLRDFSMDFELLSSSANSRQVQRRNMRAAGNVLTLYTIQYAGAVSSHSKNVKREPIESCAAKMVADKKRENRVAIFRYRIVPALVVTAIIVPVLFG